MKSPTQRASPRDLDEFLGTLFQELVDEIHLKDGTIQIVAHGGRLSFARVVTSIRILLVVCRDAPAPPSDFVVRLVGLSEFIERRLRPHVLPRLAPFGCLEIEVANGLVDRWEFCQKYKVLRSKDIRRRGK